jgi:hypothetical protein
MFLSIMLELAYVENTLIYECPPKMVPQYCHIDLSYCLFIATLHIVSPIYTRSSYCRNGMKSTMFWDVMPCSRNFLSIVEEDSYFLLACLSAHPPAILFSSENGESIFLQNVSQLLVDYITSQSWKTTVLYIVTTVKTSNLRQYYILNVTTITASCDVCNGELCCNC